MVYSLAEKYDFKSLDEGLMLDIMLEQLQWYDRLNK